MTEREANDAGAITALLTTAFERMMAEVRAGESDLVHLNGPALTQALRQRLTDNLTKDLCALENSDPAWAARLQEASENGFEKFDREFGLGRDLTTE
jgi:hypothetical protein